MGKKSKKSPTGELPQPESPSALVSEAVDFEELTSEEERDRLFLERLVEQAFYSAGKALKELRDKRLYRSTHPNFESYCRERFGYNRSRSYQYIDAANALSGGGTSGVENNKRKFNLSS